MKHAQLAYPITRVRDAAVDGNGGSRIVNYVFSTSEVARDNHTIRGWDLTNFMRNPVFLWAHDSQEPPIGKVVDISDDNGWLTGSVEYPTPEQSPFGAMIYDLVRDKFINAVSVSWAPIDWQFARDPDRPGGIDFLLADLLEISQVPVPALPTAIATARSAGINLNPLIAWTERALDRSSESSIMPKSNLTALRRAAGAPSQYVAKVPAAAAPPTKFRSLGEQLQAVARCADGQLIDKRLIRAATGAGEVDPSGGGFLVQTDFAEQLVAGMYDDSVIAQLVDRREMTNPKVKIPAIDETSRADGSRSGGMVLYWLNEGSTVPESFPRVRQIEFDGKKLIGAVRLSNELLSDASMAEAFVRKAFAQEFGFVLDRAIMFGSGVGTPQGYMNSPALITVAKETGQASKTIVWENIEGMWSRLPVPSRRRAVWIVGEDAIKQLGSLNAAVGTAGVPVYLPASAISRTPTLLGAPVLEVEQAAALGTPGDISLIAPGEYIVVETPLQTALSVHAHFLTDEAVFRFSLRVDGATAFSSPVTPYTGSNTRSPFVTLAAR